MMDNEDRELEATLRSLPTAGPSVAVREWVLRTAGARRARLGWTRPLAWALGLSCLLALDLGLDRAQSERLSRLVGDGRQATAAPMVPLALTALRQREAMLLAMLDQKAPR